MTPQAKSQQKRTRAANELAQALGFETMAKLVTAYKAGQIIVNDGEYPIDSKCKLIELIVKT